MAYVPQSGSVVSYQTVPSSLLSGVSIFGQLPAGTAPIGSVTALQGTNPWVVVGSIYGAGSVVTFQGGTQTTSIVNTVPSSVIVGASIFGQLPAGTAPLGSVATLQGTNPWITTFSNPSILAVPVGSTIAVLQTPSIVGTYAEDAAHTTADRGLFVLGVRNDNVASFVGADTEYAPLATDSTGRSLTKPFTTEQSAFRFSTSVVSGSVTLLRSSVIGKHTYLTDFSLVNSGSVATLVTFRDGSTSIIGYAVAPAGTGAIMAGLNVPWKTVGISQDLTFQQAPSASILYITVGGYQAE